MFVIFAVILGGILTGRLLKNRRLAFVQPLITFIIWALLFLLGVEVGADPAVVEGMATLGAAAFTIFVFSVAGSIAAAWLLWRRIRRKAACAEAAEGGRMAFVAAENGRMAPAETGPSELAAKCGRMTLAETGPSELAVENGRMAPAETGPSELTAKCGSASQTNFRADSAWTPADGGMPRADDPGPLDGGESSSLWDSLKGSLVIVAFFVAGCLAGLWTPLDVAGMPVSTYVLYALMFCVGITLGYDVTLADRVRRLDPRLALLPVATLVGTLAGAALAAPFVAPWSVTDSLAVGAGFGYYSLSSIFIADFRGPELATVALLCNVMREIFTLLAAPLVARWAGPLAAVSIGGATTFDTTLPVITRAAGRPYAVVSIFHGAAVDFSVPFLVTLFCSL